MILIILATLFILGLTFHQTVQGFFSAWIMTIMTILCAVVAFTYYEDLAATLYTRMPTYADGTCLIALFVIPLLVLRIIVDRFFGGNVVMGTWVDRVGGGALGLVTAMILVGMLVIAIQMLPMGASILYHEPFDGDLKRSGRIWPFCPDDFTLGLVRALNVGSLKGQESFALTHDDLLLELFCARNTAGRNGRVDTKPGTIRVTEAAFMKDSFRQVMKIPDNPRIGHTVSAQTVVLRVVVKEDVRNAADDWYRLPATHFRLVTNADRGYYPLGFLHRKQARERRGAKKKEPSGQTRDVIFTSKWDQEGPGHVVVYWVYVIPTDEKPIELVFRRIARANVPAIRQGMGKFLSYHFRYE